MACSSILTKLDNPSLDTIQILLTLYSMSFCENFDFCTIFFKCLIYNKTDTGRIQRASTYLNMACQLAVLLQLHVDPDDLNQPDHDIRVTRALRRKIWTMIYFFDKCMYMDLITCCSFPLINIDIFIL